MAAKNVMLGLNIFGLQETREKKLCMCNLILFHNKRKISSRKNISNDFVFLNFTLPFRSRIFTHYLVVPQFDKGLLCSEH